jgi:hypothetical protein
MAKPNGQRMTPPMRRACGGGKEDGGEKLETRNQKLEIRNQGKYTAIGRTDGGWA